MIKSKSTATPSKNKLSSAGGIRHLSSVFVVAWLLLVRTTASAAQKNPDNDLIVPVTLPHPITTLLRAKVVHKELRLSAAEIKEVQNVVSEFDLPLFRLRDLPPQKRNEEAAPLIKQLNSKLKQILSEWKMERLNQLVWQAEGINVLLEPQVVLKLNLSPVQKSRIRTLLNTFYNKINSLQNNPDLGSAAQRVAFIQNLQEETQKSIVSILNNSQKKNFVALMGRQFDFSQVKSIACKAPEFEIDTWLNSSPVKLSEQKGKVTVVHFYAFGCGNCIRSLPYYNEWYNDFPKSSFSIIAVHRPETKQERIIEKVREKAANANMEYPIAIDNESLAWNSWANHIWPSIYLIDKNGFVRYWWYGELNFQGAESEKLLRERINELINEPATEIMH